MATKQLQLTVTATDQFTAPMRSMADGAVGAINRMIAPINQLDAAIAKSTRALVGADMQAALAKLKLPGMETARALKQAFEPVEGVFKRVAGAVLNVQTAFVGLAGAVVAGVAAQQFNQAAEEMDKIGKAARRLGVSVEDLSSLRYQAKLANLDFDAFAGQIATAQKNLGLFLTTGGGSKGSAEAFRQLRLNFRDVYGHARSIADLLPDIADRLRAMGDAQRLFVTNAVFGDTSIAGFLEGGGGPLRQRSDEAKRLNVIMTPEMTRAAEEYLDSLTRISQAWLGLRAIVVTQVAPVLTEFLNAAAEKVAELGRGVGTVFGLVKQYFGGSDPERAHAVERLNDILDKAFAAVIGTAAVGGTLAGTAFLDSFLVAIKAFGPRLSDAVQDAMHYLSTHSKMFEEFGWQKSAMTQYRDQIKDSEARLLELQGKINGENQKIRTANAQIEESRSQGGLIFPGRSPWEARSNAEKNRWVFEQEREMVKGDIDRTKASMEKLRKERNEDTVAETRAAAADLIAQGREARATLAPLWKDFFGSLTPHDGDLPPAAAAAKPGGPLPGIWGVLQQVNDWIGARGPGLSEAIAGVFDAIKSGANKAYAALRQFGDEQLRMLGLEARIAAGRGDTKAADQLRLRGSQLQELREALARGAPAGEVEKLKQVHAIEREGLDLGQRRDDMLEALATAQSRYNETIARNAQLVQAGALRPFQATRQDQQAKDTLGAALVEAQEQYAEALRSGPAAQKILAAVRQKIEEIKRLMGQGGRIVGETMADGISDGLREFMDKASDVYTQAKQGTLQIAESFTGGLSGAIVDTITRVKSLKDAFRDFAANTLRTVAQVITQILVMRAIMGIAGAISSSGGDEAAAIAAERDYNPQDFLSSAAAATAKPRASGGAVMAGMPYLVGEKRPEIFVPQSSGYIYPSVAAGQRAMAAGGSSVTAITVNVNGAQDPQATAKAVVQAIREHAPDAVMNRYQRSPAFRSQWRQA